MDKFKVIVKVLKKLNRSFNGEPELRIEAVKEIEALVEPIEETYDLFARRQGSSGGRTRDAMTMLSDCCRRYPIYKKGYPALWYMFAEDEVLADIEKW
jgi:hypothetical protein